MEGFYQDLRGGPGASPVFEACIITKSQEQSRAAV